MTKEVVTLAPDAPVEDATDLLLRYHIHGAPVVASDGQLIGMVSFMDLARHAGEPVTVRDAMTPDPIVADEGTSVEEIAALMLDQMVRRVPVTSGGKVVGIVSASDIVQLFLRLHERPRWAAGEKVRETTKGRPRRR
jgi:CBS domain-containing protein